jgi:hypothetical protein
MSLSCSESFHGNPDFRWRPWMRPLLTDSPDLVRAFFNSPSVAYIRDC